MGVEADEEAVAEFSPADASDPPGVEALGKVRPDYVKRKMQPKLVVQFCQSVAFVFV